MRNTTFSRWLTSLRTLLIPVFITVFAAEISSAGERTLRVVSQTVLLATTNTVSIQLDAQGNENAVGFSLRFDPAALQYASVSLGSGVSGVTFNPNAEHVASGKLGIALALPIGFSFPSNTVEIAKVTFVALNAVGPSIISFTNSPIRKEISDATAETLTATYTAGTVTIVCPTITVSPSVIPPITDPGTHLILEGMTLQASGGVGPYSFSIISGTLPDGMSLSAAGDLSGLPYLLHVSGYDFTVQATDSRGCTGRQAYYMPNISPATLTNAVRSTSYTAVISASGGEAAYSFAVTAGSLPAGMQLFTNGLLTGIPGIVGQSSFTVTATDTFGITNSRNYTLNVFPTSAPDTNKPTLTITTPRNAAEFASSTVTLTGSARDNVYVGQVLVRVNGGNFAAADLTRPSMTAANWSLPIALAPGTNTVEVKSVDLANNQSAVTTRKYFFQVPSTLTVNVIGLAGDGVSPNLNNQSLFVGRNYVMTAIPGAGHLFAKWESVLNNQTNIVANSSAYVFAMKTNLTLNVNFITNQFIGAAGNYYGLFKNDTNITHQTAGFFQIKTDGRQKFSGKLYLDGEAVGFSGTFNLAGVGVPSKPVVRKGKPALSMEIFLGLDGSDSASGTVSDPVNHWTATITADRSVFSAVDPAAKYAGKYTMLLPGSTNVATEPAGDGYATITIASNGVIKATGALGDAQALKLVSSPVSKDGDWPFYAASYTKDYTYIAPTLKTIRVNTGSAIGWLKVTNLPQPAISGNLVWNKPVWTNGFYDAGFARNVETVGSGYTSPATGQRGIFITNGTAILQDGNLPGAITNVVGITDLNKIFVTNPVARFKLSFDVSKGLIRGTFLNNNNVSMPATAIMGVYLQNTNLNYAGGQFKGTDRVGSFSLKPQ